MQEPMNDLLHLAYLFQPLQYLLIPQFRITESRASTLDGFNDLVAEIASETETRRIGVDFHCAAEGLLGACCHAGSIREGVLEEVGEGVEECMRTCLLHPE